MEQLSDDLMVEEILSRIPGKTLVRCKLVSKRFLTLISEHIKQYIYERRILSQQMKEEEHENDYVSKQDDDAFIFFSSGFLYPKFDLNFDGQHLNCSVIVSCSNDLVLCCKREQQEYYVCNPVTKWWIKLPHQCPHHGYGSTGFVCEPYYYKGEGNKVVTFNPRYRFRIVFIPRLDGQKHEFEMVIYSSETGQWNSKQVSGLNDASFDAAHHHRWPAVAYGGRLYFEGRDNIMMYDPFNNDGQYQTIDYPGGNSNDGYFDVGVSCGNIRICSLQNNRERIRVWELGEDFSWRLLHHTSLPMPQGLYHYGLVLNYHGRVQVKAFHAHHGDVVFYHIYGSIFQANLKTKQVRTVATNKDWICRPLQLVSVDLPFWPTPPPSII